MSDVNLQPFWKKIYRVFAIAGLALAGVALVTLSLYANGKIVAENIITADDTAVIDIGAYDFENDAPIDLQGVWAYYPEVFFKEGDMVDLSAYTPDYVRLPLNIVTKAEGIATYRLRIKHTGVAENLSLYFRSNKTVYNMFLNGKLISSADLEWEKDEFLFSTAMINLHFDDNLETQELVISANSNEGGSLFFDSKVLMGSTLPLADHVLWYWGMWILVTGILIVLFINGLIFMVLRPEYKTTTYMTLFDTIIILRILFAFPSTYYIGHSIFGAVMSNRTSVALQVALILAIGIAGCYLVNNIFNFGKKIHIKYVHVLTAALLLLMAVHPFHIELFESTAGFAVFLGVFGYALVTLGILIVDYFRRNNPTPYYIFQLVKTVYLCVILVYDVTQLDRFNVRFEIIAVLYVIFFLSHVVLRLIDNNNSYKDYEVLNQNLEQIVNQRTAELTKANKILSDISNRDHLTGIYNRLYFEDVVEKKIERYKEKPYDLYLCMMDLDMFKNINDTYGHDIGDEQLIFFANTAADIIDEGCTFARIGGEEFVVLADDISERDFLQMLEKIRFVMDESRKFDEKRTSVSIGAVKFKDGMTYREFFKGADNCLYKAKDAGRNRIVSEM